jgi:hypothetical protein
MLHGSLALLLTALVLLAAIEFSGADALWIGLEATRSRFCFDDGVVTGEGAGVVFMDRGEIKKPYRFRNGTIRFGS